MVERRRAGAQPNSSLDQLALFSSEVPDGASPEPPSCLDFRLHASQEVAAPRIPSSPTTQAPAARR